MKITVAGVATTMKSAPSLVMYVRGANKKVAPTTNVINPGLRRLFPIIELPLVSGGSPGQQLHKAFPAMPLLEVPSHWHLGTHLTTTA